jgi:hypothetical protein
MLPLARRFPVLSSLCGSSACFGLIQVHPRQLGQLAGALLPGPAEGVAGHVRGAISGTRTRESAIGCLTPGGRPPSP